MARSMPSTCKAARLPTSPSPPPTPALWQWLASREPDPLPAKAREVLVSTPTLLAYLVDRPALVGSARDFRADALRRGGYPRFGAELAPLSRVVVRPLPLPAGAGPHLPRSPGRERGWCLLELDEPP